MTGPAAPTGSVRFEEYRLRVSGTTIDERTLLSTDYFNSFNEVVMLLGMVADMPEVLEDINAWRFRTYEEHFHESGLSFGSLAIEAYPHAPVIVRERFERLVQELKHAIDEARRNLHPATNDDERQRLKFNAASYSRRLQDLIEKGSGIVHGSDANIDQDAIDKMF